MRQLRSKTAGTRTGKPRFLGAMAGRCDTMAGVGIWVDRPGLSIGEICGRDLLYSNHRGYPAKDSVDGVLDFNKTRREGEDDEGSVAISPQGK